LLITDAPTHKWEPPGNPGRFKTEIKAVEVRNRHDRVIAAIQPDHRGGFTIKIKPMTEAHPSFRLEYARLVNERFVELVKTWFDRGAA
ncbi:hypothetical protein, partial [Sphingomonas sp. Leaf25]|uniref:hypothetical protein n=1 Tax=Sphingomonas sp. Leaf25 TaxID=1735692 RepID=UPI00138F73BF